jgi:hypothetical protein
MRRSSSSGHRVSLSAGGEQAGFRKRLQWGAAGYRGYIDRAAPRPGNGPPRGWPTNGKWAFSAMIMLQGVDGSLHRPLLRDAHYLITSGSNHSFTKNTRTKMFFSANGYIVHAIRGNCCHFCATVSQNLTTS